MTAQDAIHIFINRRKFDAPAAHLTGSQVLSLAGYGTDYELFLLQGEGDPTGGVLIGPDETAELKNGEHFRAIPGNAIFG